MLKNYTTRILFCLCIFSLITIALTAQEPDSEILKRSVFAPIKQKSNLIECTPVEPVNTCNITLNNNFTPTDAYDPNNSTMNFNPFTLGYVPQWVQTHGTPNIYDPYHPFTTVPPSPATGFAFMANTYMYDPVQQMTLPASEGIAQKIPALKAGDKYAMSFFKFLSLGSIQPSQQVNELYLVFMHCSDYNSFNTGSYFIPPFPANSQIVYCEANVTNTSWQQVLGSFTANDNYDMLWVLTKPNDNSQAGFRGVAFAYPEIVNIQTFSAGPEPTSTPPNCLVTIGPKKPNCGVANAVFTWHGPSNQTITAPANQKIQVDANDPQNVGIWTLRMTVPGAQSPAGACIAQPTDIFATVNVSACCDRPVVTPGGPIDYYIPTDASPRGTMLTSSFPTGNQWYINNLPIAGAVGQTFSIDWNYGNGSNIDGIYTTKVNGCISNGVSYTTYRYGYGWYGEEAFSLGAKIHPLNSPNYYCKNTSDKIRLFDLGASATYTWQFYNYANPASPTNISLNMATYNPNSPVADVNIGNMGNISEGVTGIAALNNGHQKRIDYHIWQSPVVQPWVNPTIYTCQNMTINIYASNGAFYSTWVNIIPGSTFFDLERYEFGPNTTLINTSVYGGYVVSSNPLILLVPGRNPQSEAIKVQFSGPSYINRTFSYNSPTEGCAKEEHNVIAWFPGCLFHNPDEPKDKELSITIFPNPTSSQITVTSKEPIKNIDISDLMNPTLKTIKIKGTKSITINVFDLKPGVYNCKITTNKGIENRKIIIRR